MPHNNILTLLKGRDKEEIKKALHYLVNKTLEECELGKESKTKFKQNAVRDFIDEDRKKIDQSEELSVMMMAAIIANCQNYLRQMSEKYNTFASAEEWQLLMIKSQL